MLISDTRDQEDISPDVAFSQSDLQHLRSVNFMTLIPFPVCVLDQHHKIVFENAAFEITRQRSNFIAQGTLFRLSKASSQHKFSQSLEVLFQGDSTAETIFVDGASPEETLWLSLTYNKSLKEVFITILSPDLLTLDKAKLEQRLRTLFDLSAMEARCATLLAQGSTAKEIANIRGVSVPTIRTQLKAIREKMDVNTSIAIAAKVSKLAMPLHMQKEPYQNGLLR